MCIFLTTSIEASEIQIVTTEEAPYQYHKDGKLMGISYEVVQLLQEELGTNTQIRFYPWARAYDMALRKENVLIVSLLRSKEREPLFKWVEPMFSITMYFYKLKSRKDIVVNTLEDARKYQIGVSLNYAAGIYLTAKNFTKLQNVTRTKQSMLQMLANRIDLLPETPIVLKYAAERHNIDYDLFEPIYQIEAMTGDVYIAFSMRRMILSSSASEKHC
jgi:polar amino acid transport system substrate-binding protein